LPSQITIIAENRCALSRGLIAEHGFSALIELDGFKLLFDSGQGLAIRQNQGFLQYDLGKIDALVLSHGHFDHTGGIAYVLEKNPRIKIYLHPAALLKRKVKKEFAGKTIEIDVGMPISRQEMESRGAQLVFVEKPLELAEGRVLISGPIPLHTDFEKLEPDFFMEKNGALVPDDFEDDLAIAIRGKKGVSVVFGCAHRGAINTLRRLDQLWGITKLDALVGGTHLLNCAPEQVDRTINDISRLDPAHVAVGHCTGDLALMQFARAFKEKFTFATSGLRIPLE
jgi:7,8-dihydropterin-6-yl-methyl-4-(beta-D-ribofuranosyl)aminobenzene 5'-phosphate synthase